jgi:ribosomal-protein-alanine N-acetyltransferase
MAIKKTIGAAESAQSDVYRAMKLDDLDEVLDIERASFLTPWTPDLFVQEFSNRRSRKGVVCRAEDGKVLGYVIWWVVFEEGHLMNIAVDPAFKRRGVATLMMDNMIARCRKDGVTRISLEVRRSNDAAILLYAKYGFNPVGLRKNYYVDEGEDAILMDLELT